MFTFNEIHQQPAMWRKEMEMLLEKKMLKIQHLYHTYMDHQKIKVKKVVWVETSV